MKETVLNGPTVQQMIDHLSQYPMDAPLRIEDADTYWTIHKIHISQGGGVVWLKGEYTEMNSGGRFDNVPEPESK